MAQREEKEKEEKKFVESMRDELWNRFGATSGNPSHIAERFDHAAAQFYVTADDPPVLADQDRRIRRLVLNCKEFVSTPLVFAYEEQDPRYGAIGLSTLTEDEYGEFKIINHLAPRISSPQATIPPQYMT